MTQLKDPSDFTSVDDPQRFMALVSRWAVTVTDIISGALDFGENIRASGPSVVTLSAAQDTILAHSLNYIPKGYLVISQTGAGSVLKGAAAWTQNTISLVGSASFTATVLVI